MDSEGQGTPLPLERRRLSGWGRAPSSWSDVAVPGNIHDIERLLGPANGRGLIPRGLGRSYGDAAQRSGGLVLDMTGFGAMDAVDPDTGLLSVEAGVSIDTLLRELLPQGWFVPVTPGTRHVTIGGAIAADIHGKNHHRDGSFCNHVTAMTLVTPSGGHAITPQSDPELFWATAGGMGLTGIVTRATVRLLPVETSWVTVDTIRYSKLEDLMHQMEAHDDEHHYSVAWVDCNSGGKRQVVVNEAGDDEARPARGGRRPTEAVRSCAAARDSCP